MSPRHKLDGQYADLARKRSFAGKAASRTLKFFTIKDVAEVLSLSTRSVRRLIHGGELPVHRFGHSVRIAEPDLRAYIAVNRE